MDFAMSTETASKSKRKRLKTGFQGKLSHACSKPTRITRSYLHNGGDLLTGSTNSTTLRKNNSKTQILQKVNGNITSVERQLSTAEVVKSSDTKMNGFVKVPLMCNKSTIVSPNAARPSFHTYKKIKDGKPKQKQNGRRISNLQIFPLGESKTCDNNHKLTEYFPVRRSSRKPKNVVVEEKQRHLEDSVLSKSEDGLEIRTFEGKGRGIVATRSFYRGEFVVEYAGELITSEEAKKREQVYMNDQNTGCYMYYFKHDNVRFCIDATPESDRLGRLVNHSRYGNLVTKTVIVDNQPHLVLIAKDNIQPGDEIAYDYGDRSKESLYYHPWLAS